MTGDLTTPAALQPGDLIHLTPHRVGSMIVGREADAEFLAAWPADGGTRYVLACRGCPLLGGDPGTWVTVVYERTTPILVTGHTGGTP